MWKRWPDQAEIAVGKIANEVADDKLSMSVLYKVQLIFGMLVPPGELTRILMAMPLQNIAGTAEDNLAKCLFAGK